MMLHEAGKAGAAAFDFVEIYPETCGAHQSAHTACWMALYFMNGGGPTSLRRTEVRSPLARIIK